MKPDPAFATSPICVTDKDYEFSVDPELITLVESDPFYGYESETVVAHLTKLNDIAALFTNNERSHYLLFTQNIFCADFDPMALGGLTTIKPKPRRLFLSVPSPFTKHMPRLYIASACFCFAASLNQ